MKNYLAVFMGKPEAMKKWEQLPEGERRERGQKGMKAWQDWMVTHKNSIVLDGCPLGKTKRISAKGIEDFTNEICAFTVVQANSHEEAAKMFIEHPHFTLFPGDSVELIEGLPIPQMK